MLSLDKYCPLTDLFGKICQGHKQNFFDKFISSLFLS